MKLTRVTLTGLDERTDFDRLGELTAEFPFVEWAVLLSKNRGGKEPRYPSSEWINEELLWATPATFPLAGHLCGEWARETTNGPFIWAINHNRQFERFGRLQINGVPVQPSTLDAVSRLSTGTAKTFIMQVGTFELITCGYVIPSPSAKVEFLVDNSGGEGKPLLYYGPPPDGIRGGYAGGIGPANIRATLEILTGLPSKAEFWIDMESSLRDADDRFDLGKAHECLRIAAEFVGREA